MGLEGKTPANERYRDHRVKRVLLKATKQIILDG